MKRGDPLARKIPARGAILSSYTPPTGANQPAWQQQARPGTLTIRDAMYYVLSHPVSTIIIGCDSTAQVEENVRLAQEFTPLSEAQLAAISAQTAPIARQALSFRSWS